MTIIAYQPIIMSVWKLAAEIGKKAAKIAAKFATAGTIGYELGSSMNGEEKKMVVYNVTTKIIENEAKENIAIASGVFAIIFIITLAAYALKALMQKQIKKKNKNTNEITVNDP